MIRSLLVGISCVVSVIALNAQDLQWKVAGSLITARHKHEVQVLANGTILVIGGITGSTKYVDGAMLNGMPIATVEVFDPVNRTTEFAAPMNEARSEFPSITMPNGRILVFGGLVGEPIKGHCTKKIEEYNPDSNTWEIVGELATERRCHAAVRITDTQVLIVGGCTQDRVTTASAEIYNSVDHTTTPVQDLPVRLRNGIMAMVQGIPMYIGGREGGVNSPRQQNLYGFDIPTGTWSIQGESGMPTVSSAVVLDNGALFVCGGAITEWPVSFSSIVYRIENGTADSLVDMLKERAFHAMAAMGYRTLLVTGGLENTLRPLSSTFIIDVETQSILVQPNLVLARGFHSLIRTEHPTDGTTFYVISGMVDGQGLTTSIEKLSIGSEESMIDRMTSVDETEEDVNTVAYPNPVSDVLHVNADPNSLVRIVDVMGHVLMSFNTDKTGHATADVSSLPVGVLNVALKITKSTENTQNADNKQHKCQRSTNNNKLVHLLKVAP